jgi:Carboxypeptidase regulatory-like domain
MRFFNLLLCLLWVGGESLLAQSYRGNLTRTVTDQSGSLVPSAGVRVVEPNRNTERVTETSAQGDYTIPQLQAGTYRIEVEARGFQTFVRNDVVVAAGSTVRINAALEVGEVTETVAVTGEAPLLQTDNSSLLG